MGGTPIMALALVGMPIDKLSVDVIRRILEGGESVCTQARIPIAGGHTIDSIEPVYGLVVMGLVHPDKVKKNSGGRAADRLILGKPLGVGVLSAAVKKNKIDPTGYRELIACTTTLNTPGPLLAELPGVHAMTDVTGFGLLGHLLPLCRSAKLRAEVAMDHVPLLPRVDAMAAEGFVTGASGRNWASYGPEVVLGPAITPAQRILLTDPQTSGGLLVACAPEAVAEVLSIFRSEGFDRAAVIGELREGTVGVAVN
jgi:selenide,water dikinase